MTELIDKDLERARECFIAEQIGHGFNEETAAATASSDQFRAEISFGTRQRAAERARIVLALRRRHADAWRSGPLMVDISDVAKAIESGEL